MIIDPLIKRSELEMKLARLNRRIDTIVSEGGEPNVINVVQKNGVALQINNKTVNVTVPTKTSDITNDSGYVSDLSNYYTKTEVDSMIGDIESLLGAI